MRALPSMRGEGKGREGEEVRAWLITGLIIILILLYARNARTSYPLPRLRGYQSAGGNPPNGIA